MHGHGLRSGQHTPPPAAAPLAPIKFDGVPLRTDKIAGALPNVESAVIRGRTTVAVFTHKSEPALTAVDTQTGAVNWRYRAREGSLLGGDGATLAFGPVSLHVVGANADAVIVKYDKGEERGIAALSGKDGRVLWKNALLPATGKDGRRVVNDPAALSLADVNDHVAVVGILRSEPARPEDRRTVAVDLATGATRWQQHGVLPTRIVGDTVLATVPIPYTGQAPKRLPIVGLDLATGTRRWDLTARYPNAEPRASAGGLAVLAVFSGSGDHQQKAVVLQANTGAELTGFGDAQIADCAADQTMIACVTLLAGKVTLSTLRVDERAIQTSANTVAPVLHGVWQGRIFAGRAMVDRAANELGPAPGRLVAISEQNAIFATDDGYAVHRIVG
ncbi:putative pyrroloquinoline-quinone binding quinoprotein [Herbihabitans rhizosphaerae]|uniref:Putative pyrroloquinoline-quinone binding quinoprotein n=1 Tax=Herbihabitans rhizosphaerae TaxID=1872711 RepID=A0A4Q7KNC4_9PSEU|nr:PQQ-binding-like beta-propeller repeat protein [Herbihabitans rhizosphaerae]RZS37874.1 putative pyrroloquinoline-quinone binding quinoprotein [Herbihabitans rhizosphaerae]